MWCLVCGRWRNDSLTMINSLVEADHPVKPQQLVIYKSSLISHKNNRKQLIQKQFRFLKLIKQQSDSVVKKQQTQQKLGSELQDQQPSSQTNLFRHQFRLLQPFLQFYLLLKVFYSGYKVQDRNCLLLNDHLHRNRINVWAGFYHLSLKQTI